ncbi:MAG: AEC family transporter [Ruminococcaceae bacterium]|nr:AEC family transporter [Oscillospiraceae bacterium]
MRTKFMESLRLSFSAIMPIFLLMLLGYVLRLLKVSDKRGFDTVNRLVFRVFLPTLLFYNIYCTKRIESLDFRLIGYICVGVLAIFFFGYFFVRLISGDNRKRGVILQSFFRSNYAILGIPLVNYICGKTSGLASILVSVVIPLFNVLAVICLERFRSGRANPLRLLGGILSNPLIIGSLLGVLLVHFGIVLPPTLEKAVSDVAGLATPLAIITLGASFTFSSIGGYLKELFIIVFTRLFFVPLILLSIAVMLGFRGEALACLLVIFGAPVAVSSFSMAQQMGGDEQLAAQAVVMTSVFCLFSLFGWIFFLNQLQLF